MALCEWPYLTRSINNFYAMKEVQSNRFTFYKCSYVLILSQNNFKEMQNDSFAISIKLFEGYFSHAKEDNFLVSTYIKDKFGRVRFLQNCLVKYPTYQTFSVIWDVKRRDVLAISADLLPDTVNIVIIFGPESTTVTEFQMEFTQQIGVVKEDKEIQTNVRIPSVACLQSLSGDFSNLLECKAEPDIVIKCGNSTFPAHKVILTARSEVFAAMLRNDLSEKRSGCVKITDTVPAIIKMFLQYMYSGKLHPLTSDTAVQLYSVAHKYAVTPLQRRCANFLMLVLHENNACIFLLLADTHNDKDLKSYIIEFILKNERIMLGEGWHKLCSENLQLSNEVLQEYFKKTSGFHPTSLRNKKIKMI